MKKLFRSKLKKFILIVLTFFVLFNFMMPTYSHASDFVGDMLEPVADFVCSIGDMVIDVLQGMMIPGAPKAVTTREGYGDDQAVPMIMYSPLAIFSNKIPALDINFLNPASNFEEQYNVLITLASNFDSSSRDDCISFLQDQWGVDQTTAETDWNMVEIIREINGKPTEAERQAAILDLLKGTAQMAYDVIELVDDEGNSLYNTDEEKKAAWNSIARAGGLNIEYGEEAEKIWAAIRNVRSKAGIKDVYTDAQIAKIIKDRINLDKHQREGGWEFTADFINNVKLDYFANEINTDYRWEYSKIDDSTEEQLNVWKNARNFITSPTFTQKAKELIKAKGKDVTAEEILYDYQAWIDERNVSNTHTVDELEQYFGDICDMAGTGSVGYTYDSDDPTKVLTRQEVDGILRKLGITSANIESTTNSTNPGYRPVSDPNNGSSTGNSGNTGNSGDSSSQIKVQKTENVGNPAANTAVIIGPIISKWYVALRNLAIVGLLIVLVYIGIRILLSSASDQVAKYKEMLMNWVMALVIVFFIHYIMLALVTVNNSIINFLSKDTYKDLSSTVVTDQLNSTWQKAGLTTKATGGEISGNEEFLNLGDTLMNTVRWNETTARDNKGNGDAQYSDHLLATFGYAAMYLALVVYTLIFSVRYLKRVIYLAFLTVIAPMVSLTYPIDKVGDGRAQAFGTWFKEYLFNLLIQPIHLLLYVVLVSSALDFAQANPLYGIIAIGFILEAEKFIKSMFGIQGENGALGAFASGALFAQGMGWLQKNINRITPKGKDKEESDNSIWQKKTDNEEVSSSSDPTGLRTAFGANNDENETAGQGTNENGETAEGQQAGGNGAPNVRLDAGNTNNSEEEQASAVEAAAATGAATVAAATNAEDTVQQQTSTSDQARREALSGNATQPRIISALRARRRRPIRRPTTRKARAKYFAKKGTLKFIKGATKAVVGGGLGLAGATVGFGAGLASGDGLEGVLKGVGIGAATGTAAGIGAASIGQAAVGKVTSGIRTVKTDFQRGSNPDRLKEKEDKQKAEAFMRDQYKSYKKLYGRGEANRKLEQRVQLAGEGLDYKALEKDKYGKKAMQLMDQGLTAKQSATLIRVANEDISKQDFLNPQSAAYQAFEKRIEDLPAKDRIIEYMDQVYGVEGKDHENMNQLRQQEKIKQEEKKRQEERKKQERQEEQENRKKNASKKPKKGNSGQKRTRKKKKKKKRK